MQTRIWAMRRKISPNEISSPMELRVLGEMELLRREFCRDGGKRLISAGEEEALDFFANPLVIGAGGLVAAITALLLPII
jgi:hypothetical protein